MVVFIPAITALVALILVSANAILYSSNIEKMKSIAMDECEIIDVRLVSMKKNLITCANLLTQDIYRIYSETNLENLDDISFISIKNNIYTALDYDKRCFDDVSSIVFVDTKGNLSFIGLENRPDVERIQAELIVDIPKKGLAECKQFPIAIREYFGTEPVLTIGKRVIDIETGHNLGYIFLNVQESKISSIFPEKEQKSLEREFFLVEGGKNIVAAMDKEKLQTEISDCGLLEAIENPESSREISLTQGKYLVTSKAVKELGWTLISTVSVWDLTKDIRVTSMLILMLGTAAIAAAVLMIITLVKLITRPVTELTEAAKRMQGGDFRVDFVMETEDEVGIFSRTFAVMAQRIEGLMEQIRAEQKRKREYELALLQSQIKPHFLYNTLDLIYVLCESGMASQGAKVTKSLADYYRTSLSSGKEVVTIQEEIKNIENYLYIQRERYYDMLQFEIIFESRMEDYAILKMTLQPLVENAIYHGIKPAGEEGTVRVSGRMEDNMLILLVEDNGMGMSKERLNSVLTEQEPEYGRHFGLRSVEQRLRLFYGEQFSMKVESELGRGTSIELRIPKKLFRMNI